MPTPLDGAPPAQLTDYLPAGRDHRVAHRRAGRRHPGARRGDGRGSRRSPSAASPASGTGRSARPTSSTRSQEVPAETIQAQIDAFTRDGFKLKDLIYAVYTSDDFVKF